MSNDTLAMIEIIVSHLMMKQGEGAREITLFNQAAGINEE